ncbi:hypothetical protein TNCT_271871 [Trichonephila clavata]|uniref:Transmembrane protein n=1 Tax=Trichonephila clavata TaxID=2740835 RepID=A0A8X6F9Z6_TRICU|nr:hypothetical protein TNCT_271871 [Trichonephila clavata]
MDEENERRVIEINTLEKLEAFAWFVKVLDVISSIYYKIPWYFLVLYSVIQIFIPYLIPEHRVWRLETSVFASFVFCYLCAKGASIFQIDVNADNESNFAARGSMSFLLLYIIRVYSDHFLEDDH